MIDIEAKINIDSTSIDEATNKLKELIRLIDEYNQKQNQYPLDGRIPPEDKA